jgi:hypothetical protein
MRVASLRTKTAAPFGSGSTSSSGGFGNNPFSSSSSGRLPGQGSSNKTLYNPVYDDLSEGTIIEQFMPVDPRRLHRIWRRIYLQDPVAGPAVELYKDMPWSDFTLTGIQDKSVLKLYADCLEALSITSQLPDMSAEFIVLGKVIGHLHMDDSKGYYTKLIVHDPDWIRVTPIPVPGYPPKLDIIPTPQLKKWATSEDPRDAASLSEVWDLVDAIRSGKEIPLPAEQSFYLPRKTSPYDTIGASAYTRILTFVAYEKSLVNGTIAAAKRRLSQIRHISVGSEDWEPDPQELEGYANLFMQGDEDPVGAIVVTRTGVTASTIGGGTLSDVVKISDEWAFLQSGKLNSLGVSEAFLRGEASYNSLEQLMSVFLEKIRAHRNFFTHYLLIDRILKPLAQKHGFVKRTEAELSHRIRVSRSSTLEDYILPDFKWEKSLRPSADRDYLAILEFMQGKGIPVTMRSWAAAGGINIDSEINQFDDDLDLRKVLSAHAKKIQEQAPETLAGGGSSTGPASDIGGLGGGLGGGSAGLGMDLDTGTGLGTSDLSGLDTGTETTPPEPTGLPTEPSEVTPEAPPNISLPTVGAGIGHRWDRTPKQTPVFKGAFVGDSESIRELKSLPHWVGTTPFLGVTLEQAEVAARKLIGLLEGTDRQVLSKVAVEQLVSTGNSNRDQILQYILARAGILHGIYLRNDLAEEVTDKLLATVKDKTALKNELYYVYAYTLAKPEVMGKPPEKTGETLGNIIKSSKSFQEKTPNTLLTGFTSNKKIFEDIS